MEESDVEERETDSEADLDMAEREEYLENIAAEARENIAAEARVLEKVDDFIHTGRF